jgi:hypothetical protein
VRLTRSTSPSSTTSGRTTGTPTCPSPSPRTDSSQSCQGMLSLLYNLKYFIFSDFRSLLALTLR